MWFSVEEVTQVGQWCWESSGDEEIQYWSIEVVVRFYGGEWDQW